MVMTHAHAKIKRSKVSGNRRTEWRTDKTDRIIFLAKTVDKQSSLQLLPLSGHSKHQHLAAQLPLSNNIIVKF